MSEILRELALIWSIVVTTCATASPPRCATALADAASWLAVRADSAVWRTVPVSSAIELAVCCSELAACSVRWLRSRSALAISLDAVPIWSLAWRTVCRLSRSRTTMRPSARTRSPISS